MSGRTGCRVPAPRRFFSRTLNAGLALAAAVLGGCATAPPTPVAGPSTTTVATPDARGVPAQRERALHDVLSFLGAPADPETLSPARPPQVRPVASEPGAGAAGPASPKAAERPDQRARPSGGQPVDAGMSPPLAVPATGWPGTGRDDRAADRDGLRIGPVELRFGYEATADRRLNFDLNAARDRDRRTVDQEAKVGLRWQPFDHWWMMAEAAWVKETRHQPATGVRDRREARERGELWVMTDRFLGLPVSWQIGRVPLAERRAWWWDDELDAVRWVMAGSDWRLDTGVGREVARSASDEPGVDPAQRDVWRWFGQARWDWRAQQRLEAFWLLVDDGSGRPLPGQTVAAADLDAEDARLTWLGLRASGRGPRWAAIGAPRLEYWADLAWLQGHRWTTTFGAAAADGARPARDSGRRPVRAHAWDLAVQARWTDLPLQPGLALAWARGSGGAAGDGVDRLFRQTGLHENKARFNGVKRLERYGQLFDPELANLDVVTLGTGVRLGASASVELVWHRYRQRLAQAGVVGARLSQAPAGLQRGLGQEFDLFFAWRESAHWELTLALSRFLPGPAYAANRRDPAQAVELGAAFNF